MGWDGTKREGKIRDETGWNKKRREDKGWAGMGQEEKGRKGKGREETQMDVALDRSPERIK